MLTLANSCFYVESNTDNNTQKDVRIKILDGDKLLHFKLSMSPDQIPCYVN
jgi:hypothetical protein